MKDFTKDSIADKKHHIGISNYSYNILKEDYRRFNMEESGVSWNSFLNQIIATYMNLHISPCNLNQQYEKLLSLLQKCTTQLNSSPSKQQSTIAEIEKFFTEEITSKNISIHSDKVSKSFSLNTTTVDLLSSLEGSMEAEIYKRPGKYTNAILESFAHKSFLEKEYIIFSDNIKLIQSAINKKKLIVFHHSNRHDYKFIPYKLEPDNMGNYLFLSGMVISIKDSIVTDDFDPNIKETPYPAAFRVMRMSNIRIISKTHYILSDEEKHHLDYLILKNGIQHIVEETFLVQVQFTEYGLELYHNQLYRRPTLSKVISETNQIYEFEGTYYQMSNYFFQFGKNAKILSPTSFKNHLIQRFQEALDNYL